MYFSDISVHCASELRIIGSSATSSSDIYDVSEQGKLSILLTKRHNFQARIELPGRASA